MRRTIALVLIPLATTGLDFPAHYDERTRAVKDEQLFAS